MSDNLFEFIADDKFRNILKRDYIELNVCLEKKASKSVMVLSGSLIEAILVEYFVHNLPKGKSEKKILSLDLSSLIDLAEAEKLISKTSKDLSVVIKNYRNLIHPGREVRKKESIDNDSANVSASIVRMIIKEVRKTYLEKYGYRADDIIKKLEHDALSYAIFEKLIIQLNSHEKTRLLNKLSEYEFDHQDKERLIEDPLIYISLLKPLIPKELIIEQLEKLFNKVETGESWEVISLYRLYHNDLNLLSSDKVEIVTLYIINVLKRDTNNADRTRKHLNDKLFTTISKNIITEDQKIQFGKLITDLVRNYKKESWTYFQSFEQILNSLDNEKRKKLMGFVESNVHNYYSKKFLSDYNDGEYLPF